MSDGTKSTGSDTHGRDGIGLQVPAGTGDDIMEMADRLGAATASQFQGTDGRGGDVDLLLVTVPNGSAGPLIDQAEDLGPTEAVVVATGAYAFEPPAGDPPEELVDVTPTSPFEVLLAGRQAAGSWTGFLVYALLAGVVAWLGLFTETIYLLTGSMLIAPFAGPAMNTAISITAGRPALLRHSVLRYLAGIAATAAIAGVLTLLVGQETVPALAIDVLTMTSVAFLLPLVAGAAGAMYLVQAEHSSLISGAAVGILVAASLAPPAGGLGMVLVLGRLELASHALFLIALQLTGITAAAVVVLRAYGLRPDDHRFGTGHPNMLKIGLAASVVLSAGLVALQLASAPLLTQGDAVPGAAAVVTTVVEDRGDLRLLEVDPAVRPTAAGEDPRVLVEVVVERHPEAPAAGALREDLRRSLEQHLRRELPDVVSHVVLQVHEPPS